MDQVLTYLLKMGIPAEMATQLAAKLMPTAATDAQMLQRYQYDRAREDYNNYKPGSPAVSDQDYVNTQPQPIGVAGGQPYDEAQIQAARAHWQKMFPAPQKEYLPNVYPGDYDRGRDQEAGKTFRLNTDGHASSDALVRDIWK